MATMPYLQLYVTDYLADTMHLSTEEHGAYLLLIMHYWRRGEPLDPVNGRLDTVTRLSPSSWRLVATALSEFFEINDEGLWVHPRIERDLANSDVRHRRAVRAGVASAAAKKAKKNNNSELNSDSSCNSSSTKRQLKANSGTTAELPSSTHLQPTNSEVRSHIKEPPPPSGAPPLKNQSDLANIPPAKPPTPAKPKKTRIPIGYQLTDRMRHNAVNYWARMKRPDLDPDTEFELFYAHYDDKPEITRADWEKTWCTWYQKAVKFNQRQNHGQHQRPDQPRSPVERLIAKRKERERLANGNVYEHEADAEPQPH